MIEAHLALEQDLMIYIDLSYVKVVILHFLADEMCRRSPSSASLDEL